MMSGWRAQGPLRSFRAGLVAVLLGAVMTTTGGAAAPQGGTPIEAASVGQGITVTVPPCVIDMSGVLGWWKGEDNLVGEVGPTLSGTVGFEDALVDRGIVLNGSKVVSGDGFPAVSDAVTVETWFKPVNTGQAQVLMSRWKFVGDDSDDAFALVVSGSGELLWLTDELSTRSQVEVSAVVPQIFDGAFHHVAATWSGADVAALYLDGALVASEPAPGGYLNSAPDTQFRLGSSFGPGDPFYFTGTLDEPTVFPRALSPAEVSAIHTAGANGKCTPLVPGAQQAKLTAADPAPDDWFGRSVSIDGQTAIVGAVADDNVGTDSGSAYVFTRSGTSWTQQAKLTASDGAGGDQFGFSVSVSGDTAVIGAFGDDAPGLNSGSAYVFTRSGTTWTQQAKLTASDGAQFDNFGRAVAMDGDSVLVGALFDDNGGVSNTGSAYVFTRSGTTWTQQAKLLAGDRAAGDGFGYAVSIDGDVALMGADLDDDGGADSGSAYVFARAGTAWTQQAKLTASDAAANDGFGYSVSYNGDTALVGAHGDDDGGSASGSAYVFTLTGATWTQQAKLTATDAAPDDVFGASVAISSGTAVLGAFGDDDGGSASGSAYVFTRSGTTWTQQAKLTATDPAPDDQFGIAVAISSGTAVLGAFGDDDGGSASGSAYVFVN